MNQQGKQPTTDADAPASTCVWCQKQFRNAGEKTLHISLLGAPAFFHSECFEEYQQEPA
jgi:hypothetical protein